ncbi:PqiA/YebS family transporter subunit [Neisseriaceae bacterium B1]
MPLPHFIRRRFEEKWQQRYLPQATMPAHTLDCPECGFRVDVPKLRQGQEADCPRCGHHLVHIEPEPYTTVLACAIAALLLMVLVYSQPFVTVRMTGMYSPLTLPNMVHALLADNWSFLGSVMFMLTFGTPFLFVVLAIYVYAQLIKEMENKRLLTAIRLLTRLRQWIMVDVFFISMLVAYIKISSVAKVEFGMAFWLMPFLVVLLLRTSVAIPQHWLYGQISHYCSVQTFQAANDTVCCLRCLHFQPQKEIICGVCGSELFYRRPASLKVSFMLLLAAMILYIPANFLPIMISENPMNTEVSTIMSGIIYMWRDGDKLIAAIIFSASIAVPTLKIVSMLWLLFSARFFPLLSVEKLSLQYRITEAVGRWSMIDIFVIIIMMTTFHTNIARVTPGPAAIYFCMVVMLTMWSAYFFDMRLIWDKQRV